MAQRQKSSKVGVGILTIILIGVALAVFSLGQRTNWFNKAAGPSQQALTNLNSASEIISTLNADGTMGPQTSYGNWSNSLPDFLKGQLVFAVIDPPPTQNGKPQELPTQAQGKAKGLDGTITPKQEQENGPQTVTALNLTVTKAEVHMAYQGKPGDQNQNGKVDHWETLNLTTPVTLDLVQLAKTKDVSKLGITTLAAGKYTEVRLYLSTATATLESGKTVTQHTMDLKSIG